MSLAVGKCIARGNYWSDLGLLQLIYEQKINHWDRGGGCCDSGVGVVGDGSRAVDGLGQPGCGHVIGDVHEGVARLGRTTKVYVPIFDKHY